MRKLLLGVLLLLAGLSRPAVADFTQALPALRPADLTAGARFGSAVAVSGKFIAVGAYLFGNNGSSSGAVYLFDRTTGAQLGKIQGRAGEQLGWSLAFSGDTLLAGAPFASRGARCGTVYQFSASTTPPGLTNQRTLNLPCEKNAELGTALAATGELVVVGARGTALRRGRVYVAPVSGGGFETLLPEGLADGDELGTSVAITGTRVVAGAPYSSVGGPASGAVYVFERSDGIWRSIRLPASPQREDAFGYAVAAGGDRVVVGAPLADAGGHDPGGHDAGAVILYQFSGVWSEAWRRIGSSAGDQLGVALAMSDKGIVAGARRRDGGRGAVELLTLDGEPRQTLLDETRQSGAELGFSVAAEVDAIVAGAFLERGAGAAYLFTETTDPPPQRVTLAFANEGSTVSETARLAEVAVQVITSDGHPTAASVAVDLAVCLPPGPCTATLERDFSPPASPLTIPAGHSAAVVQIPIISDSVVEPEESFTIHLTHPPPNVHLGRTTHRVTIRDDDADATAGLVFDLKGQSEPLVTSENGPPVTFGVKLKSRPGSDVTVSFSIRPPSGPAANGAADEGRVIDQELIFTPGDWNVPKDVRVVGLDDDQCDGAQSYQVRADTRSEDSRYRGLDDSVSFKNLDDETLCGDSTFIERPDLTVVYTVIATSDQARPDGPGPELLLELPEGAHVVTASADQGVVSIDFAGDSVSWSGPIPVGSVTITIIAGLDQAGAGPLDVRIP